MFLINFNKENIAPRAARASTPRRDWQQRARPAPAHAAPRASWSPAPAQAPRRSPSPWNPRRAPMHTVKFADEARRGQMSNSNNREQNKLCYYCNKPNHTKNMCRQRRFDLKLCLACGMAGHQIKNCNQNNARSGQTPQQGRQPPTSVPQYRPRPRFSNPPPDQNRA